MKCGEIEVIKRTKELYEPVRDTGHFKNEAMRVTF